ncbi:MAG TPA: type II secretion system F family protein [Pirellulales bacterium]|jgi:type IV pilus assembly protein PilC|nr:type II secretion system F family protein [Pirellulales bacterium]
MPIYQYEAMDSTGQEIKDMVDAPNEAEAQATIRQMGYFVTKISVKKARKSPTEKKQVTKKKRQFALGGVSSRVRVLFTRQLSILQDAGLPILRSLRILEQQNKPGRFKNCLMDVCDEIEGGATLSEAMSKSPKAFDRLYVNMIKAGEAGGALEVILRRLAEFQERSQSLKRKVKGAMVYPIVVIMVAVGILTFIMIKIVPAFEKIFKDFKQPLPTVTTILISIAHAAYDFWWAIPLIPVAFWLFIKLIRKFNYGREGWDLFTLKVPIFGQMVEKNILARTTRTLGTLVSSGVPILEALNITRETSGNAMFEKLYGRVSDSIREGESIAKPLKEHSRASFNAIALMFWMIFIPVIGGLLYVLRMNQRVVDDLVVNMVDVGEETGELDTMLYKVADTFDEEVAVLTESLTKLMEPLLIIVLGGCVGFIVIALFMPLVSLITSLTGGGK